MKEILGYVLVAIVAFLVGFLRNIDITRDDEGDDLMTCVKCRENYPIRSGMWAKRAKEPTCIDCFKSPYLVKRQKNDNLKSKE